MKNQLIYNNLDLGILKFYKIIFKKLNNHHINILKKITFIQLFIYFF